MLSFCVKKLKCLMSISLMQVKLLFYGSFYWVVCVSVMLFRGEINPVEPYLG